MLPPDSSEEPYRLALRTAGNEVREQLSENYTSLGFICHSLGELDEAEEMYRSALSIEERLGRLKPMANACYSLALLRHDQGDPRQARDMLSRARDLYATVELAEEAAKIQRLLDELPDAMEHRAYAPLPRAG